MQLHGKHAVTWKTYRGNYSNSELKRCVCGVIFYEVSENQTLNPDEYEFTLMLMPNQGLQKYVVTCGDNRVGEGDTSHFDTILLRADIVQSNL